MTIKMTFDIFNVSQRSLNPKITNLTMKCSVFIQYMGRNSQLNGKMALGTDISTD